MLREKKDIQQQLPRPETRSNRDDKIKAPASGPGGAENQMVKL